MHLPDIWSEYATLELCTFCTCCIERFIWPQSNIRALFDGGGVGAWGRGRGGARGGDVVFIHLNIGRTRKGIATLPVRSAVTARREQSVTSIPAIGRPVLGRLGLAGLRLFQQVPSGYAALRELSPLHCHRLCVAPVPTLIPSLASRPDFSRQSSVESSSSTMWISPAF